jgi:ectoine hydroxylase-related dioxygenase (phytanoyl-CoA dioxygenase family)
MNPNPLEQQILALDIQGYTVLEGLLTPAECDEARVALEQIFAAERDLPGAPHGPHAAQAYNLMNKAPAFERLYQLPPLLRLVRHFLGEDAVLSSIQAHRVHPGAPAQGLHYDGSLTGPFKSLAPTDRGRRIVGHTLGLNIAFCISPYTRTNGATRLVPGSHRCPDPQVPREGPVPGETIVEAPRGAAVIWDIATWHGASANTSEEVRYAVMTPWRRSWIRPEADLSRIVHPEVLERAGEQGRAIFGFSSRPPYVDRWQWDAQRGRPIPSWAHLAKDDL